MTVCSFNKSKKAYCENEANGTDGLCQKCREKIESLLVYPGGPQS